jgi:putative tricarboxylic transport membrane protein
VPKRKAVPQGEFWVACGIILVGVFFAVGTLQIEETTASALIGPRFYPLLVSMGLLITGVLLARESIGDKKTPDPPNPDVQQGSKPTFSAFVYITLGLLLHVLLMQTFGFVVASVTLFLCAARGFGARNWVTTGGIGLALSLATYSGFKYGLEINLPGIFSGLA